MLFSKWYLCLAAIFFNHQSTLPLLMLDGLMSHLDASLTNLYAPAPASFLWLLLSFFLPRISALSSCLCAWLYVLPELPHCAGGIVPVVNMEHKRIVSIPTWRPVSKISSRQPSRAFWNARSPLRGTNVRQHEGNLAVTLLAWFHNLECNVLAGLLNGIADIHDLDAASRYIHSYMDVSKQNTDIRSLVVLFLKDWSTKKLPASILRHILFIVCCFIPWLHCDRCLSSKQPWYKAETLCRSCNERLSGGTLVCFCDGLSLVHP